MNTTKKILALLLALLMAFALCACGSSSYKSGRQDTSPASGNTYTTSYTAEPGEYAMSYDLAADEEAAYQYSGLAMNAPAAAPEEAAESTEAPAETPDKIIYSADVTVETTDFDASLSGIDALVKQYGGWVESSSVNGSNYYDTARGNQKTRSASYTLRIPSARFQELLGSLSTLGNVPFSHVYTENVTARYYDTQARLTAYSAQEARLLEMLELAETVEDVIAIEDKLTDLRYQIESLQSTLNNWDRHVSYSTVNLNLNEVREYTPEPQVKITFWDRLGEALADGFDGAGEFLLTLVAALPPLLILAVIALLLFLLIRRIVRKLRLNKGDKPQKKEKARKSDNAPDTPKE